MAENHHYQTFEDPFSTKHSRLPDDTVFYSIYSDSSLSSTSSSAIADDLQALHLQILTTLSPLTSDYIWQHEPFSLSLSSSDDLPHLHGKLRYGDNLDDEWFVVFLLFHISLSFPSLSIRVWDSDGEFLLIEAAFHLPRWINPENSNNRVFIRKNEVHIIPKKKFPSLPTLKDALKLLIEHPEVTRASDSVQSAIKGRISEYPERARRNIHRVRVRVPISVAQVLRHEPCLISLAVEGFYDRDIDSMKYAANMEKFLPKGREEELVLVSVKMSRAMYAQLLQQKFQAPKCYPMPPMPPRTDQTTYTEAELGMKIACGFEMVYQHRKREGEEGKGGTWEAFRESLEKSGYFKGLLPGSKEYKQLMEKAEEYYRKSALHYRASEILSAPVKRIDEILASSHSPDDFKDQEVPSSDDDSWLYGGEEELKSVLEERQKEMDNYEQRQKRKQKGKDKVNDDDSSNLNKDDFDLGEIAKSMKSFVQNVSSYQGAEVPDDRDLKDVEFDMDRFMKELESVTRAPGGEDDAEEGSSDMDFDESEDESDMEEPEEHGEEKQGDFMNAYTDALNEELRSSTLKKSFVRATDQSLKKDEGMSNATEDMDEDFTPVDVDVNLVKSLLDSFSSQQGLPGPASNLLGLMGKQLPQDDADKGKGKGKIL
ncbi:protein ecdysoneless homolog [Chenopodium quinoa]|uniref:protein ecdysoneless homolog n=1 Tax=Chenopodium quinoa TaxID=63459 RepID=UPI000B77540D|nr:protein ecdysoneless homolog [Chenopodium quinoa]